MQIKEKRKKSKVKNQERIVDVLVVAGGSFPPR
jgi:hypothetical protein